MNHTTAIVNGILLFLVVIPAIIHAGEHAQERITIVKIVMIVTESGGLTLPTLREDQTVVLELFVMIGITAMTPDTRIRIFALMELH